MTVSNQYSIKGIKKGFVPQFSNTDFCLCSHDNFLFKFDYKNETFSQYCKLPAKSESLTGKMKDWLARSYLYRRFVSRSFGLSHAVLLKSGTALIIYDRIYRYNPNDASKPGVADVVHELADNHVEPPLKNGFAIHEESQNIYFGEYWCGSQKEIRVYKVSNDGRNVEVCYTFPKGEVRHIHGIHWDQYRRRLWVTTGDADNECAFYYTEDEFNSVKKFNGGDQTWRAVSLGFNETAMVWGMDAGKDAPKSAINYAYKWCFTTNTKTRLTNVGNPVYHNASLANGDYLFATNFEPGRKQDTKEQVAIYYSDSGAPWELIYSNPYKASQVTGCSQYGYVYFPLGTSPNDKHLFCDSNVVDRDFTLKMLVRR